MKKLFLLLAICFPIALFTACGDDDEVPVIGPPAVNALYADLATDITTKSALVTIHLNLSVIGDFSELGVVYGVSPLKDLNSGTCVQASNDDGNGTSEIKLKDLVDETNYDYAPYVVVDGEKRFGEVQSFTTLPAHTYVDLGLPSGTLWAETNIGASKPDGLGDYFAWGELQGVSAQASSKFSFSTYDFYDQDEDMVTKYNKYVPTLELKDDAAYKLWGEKWRMPTDEEFNELLNTKYAYPTFVTIDGKKCLRIKSRTNDQYLIFPTTGRYCEQYKPITDWGGTYWSSSVCPTDPKYAYSFHFDSDDEPPCKLETYLRAHGHNIRPVRRQK